MESDLSFPSEPVIPSIKHIAMKYSIEWNTCWRIVGAVLSCHWLTVLPAPALDEENPATPGTPPASPLGSPPPSSPSTPSAPRDTSLVPNVIPSVIPNADLVPNTDTTDPIITDKPDKPDPLDVLDKKDSSNKPDPSNKTTSGDFDSAFSDLTSSPLGGGLRDSLVAGFEFTPSLSATYDSNVLKGQPQTGNQSKGDVFMGYGGEFSYLTKPSELTLKANYRGHYDEYLNRTEFSGYSQGGGLLGQYKGGHFSLAATAGIDQSRGGTQNYSSANTFGGTSSSSFNQNYNQSNFDRLNRSASIVGNFDAAHFTASANFGYDLDHQSNNYAGAVSTNAIETTSFHSGLSARYELSAKTSITGNFGQRSSTAGIGNYSDTSNYTVGTAALWKYSPFTEIGPGVQYSYNSNTSSTLKTGRSSIGPTLNLNYKLDVKVTMTSQVGLDFSRYDTGKSADPTLSGSLGLNYQASPLWGMNLALSRNVQADPTFVGAFTENDSLRLGINRTLKRVTWSLGTTYQANSSLVPAGIKGRPNSDMLGVDTSMAMQVFGDKGSARIFVRYNDQSNGANSGYGSTGKAWNSCQTGMSLSYRF